MLLDQVGESAHPGVIRHSDGRRYSSGHRPSSRPWWRSWVAALATIAIGLTAPTTAHAEEEPLIDDAAIRAAAAQIQSLLNLHVQSQITVVRGGRLPDGSLGLVELGANASLLGFGAAIAAGFESIPRNPASADGRWRGGYGHLAAQFRPMALTLATIAERPAYTWFDPFVSLGVRVGGVHDDVETRLRAAMTLGAGIDFAWAEHDLHPVVTLRYRLDLLTAPIRDAERDDVLGTPEHFLLFGVGIRGVE